MTPVARLRGATVVLAALALMLTACPQPAPAPSTSRPAPTAPSTALISSSTSSSAPTGPGSRGLPATDLLERRHRLAQALPQETAHYRVDFTVAADGLLAVHVTLLAVLNRPADEDNFRTELRQYKAEALAFIQAQGDDPSTYTLSFQPPEANTP